MFQWSEKILKNVAKFLAGITTSRMDLGNFDGVSKILVWLIGSKPPVPTLLIRNFSQTTLTLYISYTKVNQSNSNKHPSFEVTIPWACTKMSAARPLPSAMTTGTAGLLVTDSNTVWIVFGPPSRTRRTTGIPWDLPENIKKSSGISHVPDKTNARIWHISSSLDKA